MTQPFVTMILGFCDWSWPFITDPGLWMSMPWPLLLRLWPFMTISSCYEYRCRGFVMNMAFVADTALIHTQSIKLSKHNCKCQLFCLFTTFSSLPKCCVGNLPLCNFVVLKDHLNVNDLSGHACLFVFLRPSNK